MQKVFLKFIILLFVFVYTYEYCEAKRVPGFIITENADTIYGKIKVYSFNRITGGWVFNGIDLELFHFKVSLKEDKIKRFQTYTPEDILGFGFRDKSVDYMFNRFLIESKSIVKNETLRYKFLHLIYIGKVFLYSDMNRVNSPNNPQKIVYDYYLFNDIVGLKRIDNQTSIFDLLSLYGFEKDYLDSIAKKINKMNIKMILEEYDSWCIENSLKEF